MGGHLSSSLSTARPPGRAAPERGARLPGVADVSPGLPQGMGGQHHHFGLWVDADFGKGHSKAKPRCTTYGSPQLSAKEGFCFDTMEVWAVGEPPESQPVSAGLERGLSPFPGLAPVPPREGGLSCSGSGDTAGAQPRWFLLLPWKVEPCLGCTWWPLVLPAHL